VNRLPAAEDHTNENNVYIRWLAWAGRNMDKKERFDFLAMRMVKSPASRDFFLFMLVDPELHTPDPPAEMLPWLVRTLSPKDE